MNAVAVRAAVVVAAVYGYFLIFAQFAFVEWLRAGGVDPVNEKIALGAMALAGMGGGFLAAWRGASPGMVRLALGLAAASSFVAPFLKGMPAALGVAIATGLALGMATVALSAMLAAWCGVIWVGLGTGLGYALCNVPAVFTGTPSLQAWVGTVFAVVGLLAVPPHGEWPPRGRPEPLPFAGTIALFTALVWLDAAAFFIIQHSAGLKEGTWGEGLLWRNAAVHLTVALAAGVMLGRPGARMLPVLAWAVLAVAALAVNGQSTRGLAGWLYPAGVSLYSVALVAWPGWFSGAAGSREAGWRAAWLFAIAGWFGSANGIGMAQSLNQVPPLFVAASGGVVALVVFLSDLKKWRSGVVVGAVALVAWMGPKDAAPTGSSAQERGRQVYLAEGCIHCHSQYVRPGSRDAEYWGPVTDVADVLKGSPVLIGNRRQGPDLTHVGARRSEAWLKLHFVDPQAFVPGSLMPSYAHLFDTGKGDDLVRYLKESGEARMPAVMETARGWNPAVTAAGEDGKELFATQCAVCHGPEGRGDGPLAHQLGRQPANLEAGPFAWTPAGEGLDLRVARVIKFGLPGTDMPGHEVLADAQVLALKDWVLRLRSGK